jgi:hypothetical protein
MSLQGDIFSNAIDHFAAEQEEMRAAAAFAAGTQINPHRSFEGPVINYQ